MKAIVSDGSIVLGRQFVQRTRERLRDVTSSELAETPGAVRDRVRIGWCLTHAADFRRAVGIGQADRWEK